MMVWRGRDRAIRFKSIEKYFWHWAMVCEGDCSNWTMIDWRFFFSEMYQFVDALGLGRLRRSNCNEFILIFWIGLFSISIFNSNSNSNCIPNTRLNWPKLFCGFYMLVWDCCWFHFIHIDQWMCICRVCVFRLFCLFVCFVSPLNLLVARSSSLIHSAKHYLCLWHEMCTNTTSLVTFFTWRRWKNVNLSSDEKTSFFLSGKTFIIHLVQASDSVLFNSLNVCVFVRICGFFIIIILVCAFLSLFFCVSFCFYCFN